VIEDIKYDFVKFDAMQPLPFTSRVCRYVLPATCHLFFCRKMRVTFCFRLHTLLRIPLFINISLQTTCVSVYE